MTDFLNPKSKIKFDLAGKLGVWLLWGLILIFLATIPPIAIELLRKLGGMEFIRTNSEQIYLGSQAIVVAFCFVYAIVIFALRYKAAATEAWTDYISSTFIIWALQRLIPFWPDAFSYTPSLDWYANILSVSLTGIGNVYLIAAGRALLIRAHSAGWNIAIQAICVTLGGILSHLGVRYHRFPDAAASAFCVYWVSHALLRNIRRTNIGFSDLIRKFVRRVLMVSALLYILSRLFWALIPLIHKWDWNPQLLDVAMTMPFVLLNFAIFLATFFLLLSAIIFLSSRHANEIFNPIFHEVSEYLKGDGLAKLVADRLDAGEVVLYVCIPGKRKNRYAKFSWPYETNEQPTQEPTLVNLPDLDELALKATLSGEEQQPTLSPSHRKLTAVARFFPLTYVKRLPARMAVPVIFHGAVIGCLLVISKPNRNFSRREIQDIRDLAKLSTLSIQSHRENAGLDQLSYRFSRATTLNKFSKKIVEKSDFDKAIDKVVEVLHDVLNPLATGIWLDTGLQQRVSLMGDEKHRQELERLVNGNEKSDRKLKLLPAQLEVKQSDDSEAYTIGKFAILVPAEKDDLNDPILGRNQMHFRAITTRTVSVLVGVVTEYLDAVIQEFGAKVNNLQPMSQEEWINQLQMAAEKAGVLWVIAEENSNDRLWGKEEVIEAFRRQRNKDGKGGHYLKPAQLEHSGGKLWICVRGSSYANNQNVCSLWEQSFFDVAKIADSALQRVTHHLGHSAKSSYATGNLSATIMVIFHQIINTARNITVPLKTIHNSFLLGNLTCSDERIEALIKSLPQYASSLQGQIADFKKLRDSKENNPKCNLLQAVVQAKQVPVPSLKSCGIILEVDVPGALLVGVPLSDAVYWIVTLISNSKDAMGGNGIIKIKARREGNMIRCDVTDNGPGVPLEVQPRLFRERNVTTKNSTGWGLYLVSRSLQERRGRIELTGSRPGETTFTILFPDYSGQ